MPFEIIRNDITRMKVDAIVNAANRSLLGGGGVDGMIHRAAGPELLEACRKLGGCETGDAKITPGFRLPARYVIHTVGPIWQGGGEGEREKLASCYRRSLETARENGCESIAFPLISAGAYGYPKDQALEVALGEISRFLLQNDMQVFLVIFGREALESGKKLFRDIQEYVDDRYVDDRLQSSVENRRSRLWRRNETEALKYDLFLGAAGGIPDQATEALKPDWNEAPSVAEEIPDAAPAPVCVPKAAAPREDAGPDWKEILRRTDEGFSGALLRLIDERGMTDVQCYRKANVDRKLFSKIRSNPEYRPSKSTAFAFAVALELSLPETKKLLRKAGFAMTHSSKMDLVLEYFISHRSYNIYEINEVLFRFDLPLLGSGMN